MLNTLYALQLLNRWI